MVRCRRRPDRRRSRSSPRRPASRRPRRASRNSRSRSGARRAETWRSTTRRPTVRITRPNPSCDIFIIGEAMRPVDALDVEADRDIEFLDPVHDVGIGIADDRDLAPLLLGDDELAEHLGVGQLLPDAIGVLGAPHADQGLHEGRVEPGRLGDRVGHRINPLRNRAWPGPTPAVASTLRSHGGGAPASMARVRSSTSGIGAACGVLIGWMCAETTLAAAGPPIARQNSRWQPASAVDLRPDLVVAVGLVRAGLVGRVAEADRLDEVPAFLGHVVDGELRRRAEMRVEPLHVARRDRDAHDPGRRRPSGRGLRRQC